MKFCCHFKVRILVHIYGMMLGEYFWSTAPILYSSHWYHMLFANIRSLHLKSFEKMLSNDYVWN